MPFSFGKNSIRLVQWAAVCVFLGRAYQHLFWDAPYREILWDPNWTGWLVSLFTDFSWDEYVTHPRGDVWIQRVVFGQGVFYLVCALAAAFVLKLKRGMRWLLLAGAAFLVLLAVVYTKDRFFHLGQFFEYSLQFSAPVFLYLLVKNVPAERLLPWAKVAIALTFTCHGLYAVGFYPRPAVFMEMTQRILGLSNDGATHFLNLAGALDFAVSILIFFPKKWRNWALAYAIFWGLLTCLARVVGNFYWEYPTESLHQWVFETVYRTPHFLMPWWAWKMQQRGR